MWSVQKQGNSKKKTINTKGYACILVIKLNIYYNYYKQKSVVYK